MHVLEKLPVDQNISPPLNNVNARLGCFLHQVRKLISVSRLIIVGCAGIGLILFMASYGDNDRRSRTWNLETGADISAFLINDDGGTPNRKKYYSQMLYLDGAGLCN